MSRNTIFRLNFYLLDCTRTCLFPHNNHVRSIQRIKKGRARERALKSFLKWMVSLPWHGRGSPFSSLPPSLSRPQSMKVQMGGNDVALFTFFHTRATTRRESGLWPALNRRRGDGRHRRFSSFPFSFTPFVTDPKKFLDPYFTQTFSSTQSLSLFNWDKGRRGGGNWNIYIPRFHPETSHPRHETSKVSFHV